MLLSTVVRPLLLPLWIIVSHLMYQAAIDANQQCFGLLDSRFYEQTTLNPNKVPDHKLILNKCKKLDDLFDTKLLCLDPKMVQFFRDLSDLYPKYLCNSCIASLMSVVCRYFQKPGFIDSFELKSGQKIAKINVKRSLVNKLYSACLYNYYRRVPLVQHLQLCSSIDDCDVLTVLTNLRQVQQLRVDVNPVNDSEISTKTVLFDAQVFDCNETSPIGGPCSCGDCVHCASKITRENLFPNLNISYQIRKKRTRTRSKSTMVVVAIVLLFMVAIVTHFYWHRLPPKSPSRPQKDPNHSM